MSNFKPIHLRGVTSRDGPMYTVGSARTADDLLLADVIPKLLALGLIWNGDPQPVHDQVQEVIGRLRNGFTLGHILTAEDVINFYKTNSGKTSGSPSPTSTMDRIAATQQANENFRTQKAAASRDAAPKPFASPATVLGKSIASINAANRLHADARRAMKLR